MDRVRVLKDITEIVEKHPDWRFLVFLQESAQENDKDMIARADPDTHVLIACPKGRSMKLGLFRSVDQVVERYSDQMNTIAIKDSGDFFFYHGRTRDDFKKRLV